jgi:hypothetical protein
MHDGFRLGKMLEYLRGQKSRNIVLDTHIYLGMSDTGAHSPMEDTVFYILKNIKEEIAQAQAVCPTIVGEWCLAHHDPNRETLSRLGEKLAYRLIADAQLTAWESGSGFYFWSYKLPSNPPGWSFVTQVEREHFPHAFSPC